MNGGLLIQILRRRINMKHYAYNSPFKMIDSDGKEHLLTVKQDDYASNPRDEYNLATMICWHRNYRLGDKHEFDDVDEFLQNQMRMIA